MQAPLSKQLLEWFGCEYGDEEKLRKELNNRLKNICKPCWELKYCPYGPMVEDFPLPALLLTEHREYLKYIKECLATGRLGEDHSIQMDEDRKRLFWDEVNNNDESYCVETLSKFETDASCKEFGHLCPAYFVSEPFTETSNTRNRTRNITHATVIRVVRRDNNTCQVCGRILLDKEIEIDHIIPYSRGGTSDESNLRVTCLDCNRKKGKRVQL